MRGRRNILPLLSLALAVAALAAYPLARNRVAGVAASGFGLAGAAAVGDGGLLAGGVGRDVRTEGGGHFLAFAEPPWVVGEAAGVFDRGAERQASKWGFSLTRPDPAVKGSGVAARVPLWSVAALCCILPLVRLRSILRVARRRRSGRCAGCGYDLRHSPDRCPECGLAPA